VGRACITAGWSPNIVGQCGSSTTSVIERLPLESPEHQKRLVRDYMLSQAPDDDVIHLEKVATERIFGRRHDVWDVHTEQGRWWVVSDPLNLYSQIDFKSMDVALSFHLGLMQRVYAHHDPTVSMEEQDRLSGTWRRWTQAAEALDRADEAEEFQAVGMRLRECLLSFVREAAKEEMVPEGETVPKRADFVHWSEHIADVIAAGPSSSRLRTYLKATAKEAWEYVNWLTHSENAARFDAQIAVDIASNVLQTYGTALVRWERGSPDRCPSCSSYRLTSDYRPESADHPYVTLCESCGWESTSPPTDAEVIQAQPPPDPLREERIKEALSTPHVLTSDISTFVTPADVRRRAKELDAAERARNRTPSGESSSFEDESWANFFAYELDDGRVMDAHRVAFIAVNGDLPPGRTLRERCDDTACVNPAHADAVELSEPEDGWSRVVFEWVRPHRKGVRAGISGVRVGNLEVDLAEGFLEHFHLKDATMLLERHFFLAREENGWVRLLPVADRLEPGRLTPGRAWLRPAATIGRNDICQCGSGRKYKNCHGARLIAATRKPD
jgi:hypothetical protein